MVSKEGGELCFARPWPKDSGPYLDAGCETRERVGGLIPIIRIRTYHPIHANLFGRFSIDPAVADIIRQIPQRHIGRTVAFEVCESFTALHTAGRGGMYSIRVQLYATEAP